MRALALLAFLALAACKPPPPPSLCPGFEVVDTGSGCRETATGQYVDKDRCGECDATEEPAP